MRAIRIALLSLAGAAALVPVAAVAQAAEDGDITSFAFSVSPATVAPGDTVTLEASACEVPTVTVSSGVFDTVTLTDGRPGEAAIDEEATPGAEYEVAFDCDGEKGLAALTLADGSGGGHRDPATAKPGTSKPGTSEPGTVWPPGTPKPPVAAKPGGGVKAGAGGSFSDLGPAQLATGSVLIAGALGAGGVLLLRRRPGDGDRQA